MPYDRNAVTSLVILGTCLLAPVAVWLGVRGIVGTKGGVRRGRWCAVIAVIGGLLSTSLMVAGIAGGERFRDLTSTKVDLSVGDCVDALYADNGAGALVDFDVRPCTAPHESEVAFRGQLKLAQVDDYERLSAADLCTALMGDRYTQPAKSGRFVVDLVTLGDPDRPTTSDTVYCLLANDDGAPLSASIGAGA
ncbi:hypothetical protein ASD81_19280 [Nocardioides sp. Root614]|nr:hypothetical protein ASD81_19280 [Nocardioides sp. Root614]KRA86781.1 hypothetical protein ASD84_21505 [Nocardioides sp. Root682]